MYLLDTDCKDRKETSSTGSIMGKTGVAGKIHTDTL